MAVIRKGFNPNLGKEFMERYRGSVIGLRWASSDKPRPQAEGEKEPPAAPATAADAEPAEDS